MIVLSSAQKDIVHAPMGYAIQVLASAGSGKTRVLTERVRYLIENNKKGGVIALTFTNKAAEEMGERLSDNNEVNERCWIATIHAVAQRIIDSYGHTIGLPKDLHIYERDKDRMEVFLQSLRNQGVDIDDYLDVSDDREKRNREKNLQKYMNAFSIIKRELLNEDEVGSKYPNSPRMWYIYQDYQSALLESGGIDFDDILLYAHRILLNHEWVAKIYQTKYIGVCVDEAQDLNKSQYEFIKALCGCLVKNILMVGDSNQMIYGFNGSSVDYFCNQYLNDYSPMVFSLKENYRSSKAVIELANKLKPNSQIHINAALDGFKNLSVLVDEKAEAAWVCDQIQHILSVKNFTEIEGEVKLDNMVVIGRNRFVFRAIEEEMECRKIPFYLKKTEKREEPNSLFGKVLDLSIRVRINAKDWIDGKKLCSILSIPIPDTWGEDMVLMNFSEKLVNSNTENRTLLSKLLKTVYELESESPNIIKLYNSFKKELETLAHAAENGEQKEEIALSLDDLDQFYKMWINFKKKGLGQSLLSFRNALSLGQLSDDVVRNGITLSTVHTMKGLEKDIVFLIGMCEGVFPDYRAKTETEIEEERNSAFVAVTRSRRWIYITAPEKRIMPWGDFKYQKPSRFLVEMM
ncbi:ATP-dependent helicase [Serratia fonticola]|uniref:ATP-dependent helicase n=1 Tax=Serratia fonticola TaxID=47917 RepID=UPI001AEAB284|nr:ATP-dependent helicase [Serratia fonticola]MBP1038707.1 ATP-dependent helicase [Serratia fonticola]